MDKKKKGLILTVLAIISVIAITIGVTYSFFNYAKEGTTENTITTDTITFLYTETSKVGRGIMLENAYPISDSQGKSLTGEGNVFDFKVTSSNDMNATIPYEITARKKSDSTLPEEAVRIYLTKVNGTEEEVLLDNYSELPQTDKVQQETHIEKTLYKGKVQANESNYNQEYRLRMWVDEDVDFSPDKDGNYQYNNKTFTVTVNVYANAKVVTDEEIAYENSTEIASLSVDNTNLTAVTDKDFDYEATLPEGTTSTEIVVETENPNATVEVEKIDSLAYSSNIKRLAATKTLDLTAGDNYFKITVTSENKQVTNEYKIRIYVGKIYQQYKIGDEITLIDGSKWHVLEASNEYTETVVLLSDYNLNSDGSYNTTCLGTSGNKDSYVCSPISFDVDDTNIYDENDANNIGYFVKNTYAQKVNTELPDTTNITIPTAEQVAIADGQSFNQSAVYLNNLWLITTNYWTKTSHKGNDSLVWYVGGGGADINEYVSAIESSIFGVRPTITTPKSNIVDTMSSTTPLAIGTAVEAIDGSKWHVLEASSSDSKYVTLLSDYNLNSDGTYNTECGRDINSTYTCNTMAFDADNTNDYDESDNNNIGYFIKNTYKPLVTTSLLETINVTIPTAEQIAKVDGQTFNQSGLILSDSWFTTTNYCTKTANVSDERYVWCIYSQNSDLRNSHAVSPTSYGARPVITTLKTNLLNK